MGDGYQEVQEVISIHAPTRGATSTVVRSKGLILFQSTLPREERPSSRQVFYKILHFNPRSHERSDGQKQLINHARIISIHAPTRGATEYTHINVKICVISIHAPTRGATRVRRTNSWKIFISIHAPTRGATAQHSTGLILA